MTEMSEQPEQEQDQGEIKQVRRAKSGFWFGILIAIIYYSLVPLFDLNLLHLLVDLILHPLY